VLELEELEGVGESPPETKDHLIQQCIQTLQLSTGELALFGVVMTFRKGKRLIARLLPWLAHEGMILVLMAVVHTLPQAVKKDSNDKVQFPQVWMVI